MSFPFSYANSCFDVAQFIIITYLCKAENKFRSDGTFNELDILNRQETTKLRYDET